MAALAVNVIVLDEDGTPVVLTAGSEVPKWAADQLGAHCFGGVADDEGDSADGEPPKAGPGSGKAAWAAYAESVGVDVEEDATREDIIAAVETAK